MDYQYSIQTPILTTDQRLSELTYIIELLRSHDIKRVDLWFGWPWGDAYGNWTPFQVSPDEILFRISEAESLKAGSFVKDDLAIIITNLEMEILFCHEYDLHLDYNLQNSLVTDILDHWKVLRWS